MRYGISTYLHHHERLCRRHLLEIAAHGFESIELFALRTHFDYQQAGAIAELAEWLRDAGLDLHSIHAPIATGLVGNTWGPSLMSAATDRATRAKAVWEAGAALSVAREIPTEFFVVHLGLPGWQVKNPSDNDREAASRSLEEIAALTAPLGARVAVEVIPNDLSSPASIVRMLEEETDLPGTGLCMDFGHARLAGDVTEAIEASSGFLITTHVHDNHGQSDEHLAPFEGIIDWPAALMALQKIGFEGTLLFELDDRGDPGVVLDRAEAVCRRFDLLLGDELMDGSSRD